MLFLSTLKGITRDGSLETLAEVGHPGPGGDTSEVCNRYQDVIASTPVGDELRARYGQVLFIVDNQVRNQLEFPPPSVTAAETTDTGGSLASSPGEGGGELSKEQVIEILQGKSIEELTVIATEGGLTVPEEISKDELVELIMNYAERPESARPLQTGEKSDTEEKTETESAQDEPDLLSGAGETSPGSMSPKGKGKGK